MSDTESSGEVASPEDLAYEAGWHDGVDYGYRLARSELEESS